MIEGKVRVVNNGILAGQIKNLIESAKEVLVNINRISATNGYLNDTDYDRIAEEVVKATIATKTIAIITEEK